MSLLSFANTNTSVKALTATESQHQLKKNRYREYSAAVMVILALIRVIKRYMSNWCPVRRRIQIAQGQDTNDSIEVDEQIEKKYPR